MPAMARYIMIGGFLGAGKTTAVLAIAKRLRDRGRRVGLITNDQSFGLVDTTMLGAHGFDVEEITGGCFCCKFNSLIEASDRLSADARPDDFIAEPVGSCTDLKATVDYPLRRIYGDNFAVAPLSVMVDPNRAARILGLEEGNSFSERVIYIYRKQLEEADLLVVNKVDRYPADRLPALLDALRSEFPKARVLAVSARQGTGIDEWLDAIDTAAGETRGAMEVDYDTYADGEALLGWVNCTADVSGTDEFDGNALLCDVIARIARELQAASIEIAHLKLTLTPSEGSDLGVANLVRNDAAAELAHRLKDPVVAGQLIVNLRAEGDPEILRSKTSGTLADLARERNLEIAIAHLESFRPGRPTPTHRLTGVH